MKAICRVDGLHRVCMHVLSPRYVTHVKSKETMSSETKKHGPWQIVDSHEVYRDPWTSLRRDEVIRPDGEPGLRFTTQYEPGSPERD